MQCGIGLEATDAGLDRIVARLGEVESTRGVGVAAALGLGDDGAEQNRPRDGEEDSGRNRGVGINSINPPRPLSSIILSV